MYENMAHLCPKLITIAINNQLKLKLKEKKVYTNKNDLKTIEKWNYVHTWWMKCRNKPQFSR